jgi:PAS domain S-box-containing protein
MKNPQIVSPPQKGWLPLVLLIILTIGILIISIISLYLGWTTIFQNIFYFPIIFACVYYVKRGFVFSVLLACGYFVLMAIFSNDPVVLQGALIRVLIFILVAGVITYLSIIRIRAEDALKESEEFNRGLVENIPNLIVVYNHDRKIRYVNPAATTTLGYSVEEMVGTDIITYVNPPQQEEIAAATEERFSSDMGKSLEIDLITKAGQHLTVISKGAPLNFQNQPAVLILFADITDRKQAEEELNATETRYRRLFETAQDGILILDAETGQIVEVNPFLIAFLGFSREQFLGKKIWEIGLFKDIVANKDNFEELQQKESIRYENLPLETADGRNIAVEFVSNVYMVNDKKVIQCNIRDITERKKLADLIKASLAEKETLLREIHHRVKNNLQIITSVLNLQIRKLDDPKTIETLRDSQNRVMSMALVHEHLYKGKDFTHIDLGGYIRALGAGLFQSYEAANEGIRFDLNIRDIFVDINSAIPLGLISNELITNSIKYAFKGKKDGKLSITATEDPHTLTYIVADNGVGIPEGITLENQTTLGLRLIQMLTSQLHGTVVIDRTGGTKFVFTIPRVAEQKPAGEAGP